MSVPWASHFFNVVENLLPVPSVERLGSLFKAPTPGIDNSLLEKIPPWTASGCRIWLFLENGPVSTPSGPPRGRCRTWPVVDHPRGMKASGNDAASKFACTDAICYCQKSSRDAPVQENPLALMRPQRPSGVGLPAHVYTLRPLGAHLCKQICLHRCAP